MWYCYECEICEVFEKEYAMGKARKKAKCPTCGILSERIYNFQVRIPNPLSEARRGRGSGGKKK